jgi:hypothetical protein
VAAAGLAIAFAFVSFVGNLANALVNLWTTPGSGNFTRDGTIGIGERVLYLPPVLASLATFLVVLGAAALLLRRLERPVDRR